MSYSVELAEKVVKTVVGWNLSSRLQNEILKRLDALGISPNRCLARLPAPADHLVFQFVARDPGEPPRNCLFSFSVAYRDDEQTLVDFDCDLLSIEADPGAPPVLDPNP